MTDNERELAEEGMEYAEGIGRALEDKITSIFHGNEPRCECCGNRSSQCRWRAAYQMMLCPDCPPVALPKRIDQ